MKFFLHIRLLLALLILAGALPQKSGSLIAQNYSYEAQGELFHSITSSDAHDYHLNLVRPLSNSIFDLGWTEVEETRESEDDSAEKGNFASAIKEFFFGHDGAISLASRSEFHYGRLYIKYCSLKIAC